MFLIFFAFWIILNGTWTSEIAVIGVVLSALLYLFVWRFMGYSPKREWQIIRRLGKCLSYACFLLGQIFQSAGETMRLIWTAREVTEPKLTMFRSRLRTKEGRVLFANSITLTPGTITAHLRDDLFVVHCLDKPMAEGLCGGEMEERIARIEDVSAADTNSATGGDRT
ncbi:MAG: Na+/H+ antiporter subunit E [Clostridia bacterium]|nr:Na+/H+ antiporter subunit E [Clostridia bacterium]